MEIGSETTKTKVCNKCGATLGVLDFAGQKIRGIYYIHHFCRACEQATRLKRKRLRNAPVVQVLFPSQSPPIAQKEEEDEQEVAHDQAASSTERKPQSLFIDELPLNHEDMRPFQYNMRLYPLWVVAVQWRRYQLLGLQPAPRWRKRTLERVATYIRTGSLKLAARTLLRKYNLGVELNARLQNAEAIAIRRAVYVILEAMQAVDHGCCDWVDEEVVENWSLHRGSISEDKSKRYRSLDRRLRVVESDEYLACRGGS
jgi:hypothetical protein